MTTAKITKTVNYNYLKKVRQTKNILNLDNYEKQETNPNMLSQ